MTRSRAEAAPVGASGPTLRAEAPLLVVGVLYLVALGGRFTADRLGATALGDLDLRLPGVLVVVLVVAIWRFDPGRHHPSASLGAPAAWMVLLLAWLALSALWAVPAARIGPHMADLVVLLVLALGVGLLHAVDADQTARALLWCGYVGGLVYAVAGLVIGETNVQGRLTAFGGGPNVFARVIGVGIIAAIVLYALTRRHHLLLAVPVLAVALLLSGSRGAAVAGAVSALAFVVLFPRRCRGRGILLLITLTSLIALVIATFFPTVVGLVRERLALTLEGDDSGRGLLIEQAWNLITSRPLQGAGLDAYWATYGRSISLDYPHNVVLEIGATGGLIALTILAAFVASVARGVRPRADLPTERVGMVVLAVFMFAASLFSGDLYDSRFFWLFAIAATGSSSTLRRGAGISGG